MDSENKSTLKKELSLFDIYAVSTGAMFSSGFFLLPGLAAAQAGPAAFLAYLLAGILILPAMFSQAELCTAMPRAGGSYFFLDRSLGPLVGTIGGLGTYFGLVLKTGFALLGIGVYLAIYLDIPIRPLALLLVVAFAILNVVGAKEATWLQRFLVVTLLGILGVFIVGGFAAIAVDSGSSGLTKNLVPFLPFGVEGLVSTIALVFVSYAGLTKVASVAEEVKNPERDIPLGMILSLATTSVIYVLGVALVVIAVPAEQLHHDLAPLATATEILIPGTLGKWAVAAMVVAAIAAFASTGNAGLLASSRYPLAMARDRLLPEGLGKVNSRLGTPIPAILVTSGLMAIAILLLSEDNIAKLASAFQLVVFALICMAVIVMRESGIIAYDPGFKSPLYPWMQIAGIVVSVVLLAAMNELVLTLLGLVIAAGIAWYLLYARSRVAREGALLHWFAQLGMRRCARLDVELRQIIKEKGPRDEDDVTGLLRDAIVLDLSPAEASSFDHIARTAALHLAERLHCSAEALELQFTGGTALGITPVGGGVGLPHARIDNVSRPCMAAVRVLSGVQLTSNINEIENVKSLFFLVSPTDDPRRHLRVLARIAVIIEDPAFMSGWLEARNAQALHEFLLNGQGFRVLHLDAQGPHSRVIGLGLADLNLPDSIGLSFIRRKGRLLAPDNTLCFEAGDVLILDGDSTNIHEWLQRLTVKSD